MKIARAENPYHLMGTSADWTKRTPITTLVKDGSWVAGSLGCELGLKSLTDKKAGRFDEPHQATEFPPESGQGREDFESACSQASRSSPLPGVGDERSYLDLSPPASAPCSV